MTRRTKRSVLLLVLLAALGVGALLTPHIVRATVWAYVAPEAPDPLAELCALLAKDREAAYQLMAAGDPWQAMASAAISLRAIPGDDPTLLTDALADEAAASLHLTVFGMKDLLDEATCEQFIETVLDPVTYPSDAAILMYYRVSMGPTFDETQVLLDELWALAESTNPVGRSGALTILASPWCFEHWPHRAEARQLLIAEYPDLDMTRTILRMSLGACKRKPENTAQAMDKVLTKELVSDADRYVLDADPVAVLAAQALPSLLVQDAAVRAEGVAHLCSGITDSEDWHVRFGCLNLVPGFHASGHAALVESYVAALAASDFDTPDVTRATCMILGFSMDAKDAESAAYWADELLALERIVDPFERPLHEEAWHTIDQYGEYLASIGNPKAAALAYEQLAAKYPNSALAERFLEKADEMRRKTP